MEARVVKPTTGPSALPTGDVRVHGVQMGTNVVVGDAELARWVARELTEVHRRLNGVAAEVRRQRATEDIELLGAEHALRRAAFLLDALEVGRREA